VREGYVGERFGMEVFARFGGPLGVCLGGVVDWRGGGGL